MGRGRFPLGCGAQPRHGAGDQPQAHHVVCRLAATLRENFELALLFRRIATVESDTNVVASVDEMEWRGPNPELVPLAEKINGLGLAERAIRLAQRRAG